MYKYLLLVAGLFPFITLSQTRTDSIRAKKLDSVVVKAWMQNDISRLSDEHNGFLIAGKKNEVINLSETNANIAVKTARQVFAKVPGVFVYDMDGTGNQVNISTRGLDPHRGWEFNIRQNGVLTNSDMYGYPASHYSAPMESYENIELLRGAGSLQYGAEFGGMLNYVTKKPDGLKSFSFESINTAGSFGLLSTYNAISGTIKKFSYYAYYYKRHSNGYRDNSETDADAQFVSLQYNFTRNISLKAEFGRTDYNYQIPGPLTDSMFHADPAMSTRSRNYFDPAIYVPSLTFNWQLAPKIKLMAIASGVYGQRSSVQLDAFATVPDAIDPATLAYKNRQVDIDNFHSNTIEVRLMQDYNLGSVKSKLSAGVIYMNNDLHRRQLGKGTTGSDYDLTLVGLFQRDLHFKTGNIAFYVEDAFKVTSKWTISPGIRYENGASDLGGSITYYPEESLPNTIAHKFALLGVSTQYVLNTNNNIYGGISQAYRPVVLKDIIPATAYEQVNKDLKDAYGYNAEVGIRGSLFSRLYYDLNYFHMLYKNRLGSVVLQDASNNTYIYRTNIGNSVNDGLEAFIQYKFPISRNFFAGIFTSTSFMNDRYVTGQVASGTTNQSVVGNKVESAPQWISRNGLEFLSKGFSATILYSYTASSYADALNTVTPTPNGAKGIVPSYSIWDVNASFKINKVFNVRAGISNLFDAHYFTKRPTFYPGPGVWPSDGRNASITLGIKI
ncbi:TonB-dependent receptor [Pedobacter sp. HMF7647]|uniref:TonB-dependent receptor n=1 Tax=Hufsiella arboris TaxID=2695275 RepID=A0A7K1Y8X1_9SPHI|nr:TonB-dependent receptor [Hufsiella arboris]MXV51044.1 TonB-dependent receptor [Hufsiella arboris]